MRPDLESATEQTPLLPHGRRVDHLSQLHVVEDESSSIIASHVTNEELALGSSTIGERLPYNDYTTIDWLHDLVKDSYRFRSIHGRKGLRSKLYALFDSSSGWIAAALIGSLTACVAFLVDVAEATVSDWKTGYCKRNPLMDRAGCCTSRTPLISVTANTTDDCLAFHEWSRSYWSSFGIYVGFALAFGLIAAIATTFTKRSLPAAAPQLGDSLSRETEVQSQSKGSGKSIYMAAGSGIPEIKTILSGFVIPHFLDFKVLFVKAFGATFAVATGMCLGKEGPFVHISGCVGYLVAQRFTKYRNNGRKLREILAAAVAAGLSVAFGAPIGGVLFAYEEISTYFPRKVLWRAFLCSLFAAVVLKALNPTGTGKLVLFETDYGTRYKAYHYLIFVLLGVAGGLWGGLFCKANYKWSKWFRTYPVIKNNPVFEVFLVVLATGLLQYPNPIIREPGDVIIKNLLVNCHHGSGNSAAANSWVCQNEARTDGRWDYIGWLAYGCAVKLILTIITFGAKVPSGIIIPALDAGALFGRLVGQWIGTMPPGIFATVSAAGFLAGVSRMTLSLCVIMFELTGELEYVVPHMISILVAKWVADSLSSEGVYDLAQSVLGHPFLDPDHSMKLVQEQNSAPLVRKLIPPPQTMEEITVHVGQDNTVPRSMLDYKLRRLQERGLMDAGVVLVQDGMLQGYLAEAELDFGLNELGKSSPKTGKVRLLGDRIDEDVDDGPSWSRTGNGASKTPDHPVLTADTIDFTPFVDRTPLTICDNAPMEYAVEMFGRLGLRHLMVVEEGSGKLVGVVIKKRLIQYLSKLR